MKRYLFVLAVAALSAQESSNAIPRNTHALQSAIAGIGKRPLPVAPQRVIMEQPPQRTCSIPLQSMAIDSSKQFSTRRVLAPDAELMPRAALPAPPCETATR